MNRLRYDSSKNQNYKSIDKHKIHREPHSSKLSLQREFRASVARTHEKYKLVPLDSLAPDHASLLSDLKEGGLLPMKFVEAEREVEGLTALGLGADGVVEVGDLISAMVESGGTILRIRGHVRHLALLAEAKDEGMLGAAALFEIQAPLMLFVN